MNIYIVPNIDLLQHIYAFLLTGGNRLAGFKVYITSTNKTRYWTSTEECYAYPLISTVPDNKNVSPFNVECTKPTSGRYVTIYNERLPHKSYPSTWSNESVLVLCEVEIIAKGQQTIVIDTLSFALTTKIKYQSFYQKHQALRGPKCKDQ